MMKKTHSLVSVILPVYNGDKTILNAVNSILEQSYSDFELIIINDGSTDKTKEILSQLTDPRIRIYHQKNQGLAKSLNKAIGLSKGKYIARMDADDISINSRLKKQYTYLEEYNNITIVGSYAMVHYPNGDKTLRRRPTSHKALLKNIVRICPFFHSSVMFRKNDIIEVGKYNNKMDGVNSHYYEDYELWVRLLKNNYQLSNIPEPLIEYYIVDSSILRSKNLIKRIKTQVLMRTLIIKQLDLPSMAYLDILFVTITSLASSIIRLDKIFNALSSSKDRTSH